MPNTEVFEHRLQDNLFSKGTDKTFIDKVLGRQEVDALRELIRKEHLNRKDLLDILYLITASESKLYNFGEWERYIILKFFVWIREYVKVAEQFYDYSDDLKLRADKGQFKLTARTTQILYNNERLIEHNVKFLIDLYLNICRTSLSLGATAFMEILKSKFELHYSGNAGVATSTEAAPRKKFLGII